MDKDSLFSIDEMSVLEALEIKGGAGSGEPTQNSCQNSCSNNVEGCACSGQTNPVEVPTNPSNPSNYYCNH